MEYTNASQILSDFNAQKITMVEAQEFLKTLESKNHGPKRKGFKVTASTKGLLQITGENVFWRGRYFYPEEALTIFNPENVRKALREILENKDIKATRLDREQLEAECIKLLKLYDVESV